MTVNDYLFVSASIVLILFIRNLIMAIRWEILRRGFYSLSDEDRQKIMDIIGENEDEQP